MTTKTDKSFLEACKERMLGRWFEVNQAGGPAFKVTAIYKLGSTNHAVCEIGSGAVRTVILGGLFNDLLVEKIVDHANEEAEEDPSEY